jgi:hypothetical protein
LKKPVAVTNVAFRFTYVQAEAGYEYLGRLPDALVQQTITDAITAPVASA